MRKEHKRLILLSVAVAVISAVILFAVLSFSVFSFTRYEYYGKSNAVECKILYCKPCYKTLRDTLIYDTYYGGAENGANVLFIKIDKPFGTVSGPDVSVGNYSFSRKDAPCKKWIKMGEIYINPNEKENLVFLQVEFRYGKDGFANSENEIVKLTPRKLIFPVICKSPCINNFH